jgi:hypothetical protein
MNSSSITNIMSQQISAAIQTIPAGTYILPADSGKLSQEILVRLGLIVATTTRTAIPVPASAEADAEEAEDDGSVNTTTNNKDEKARKRTVSKKMKDTFLESGSAEDLKKVIKAYKNAPDATIAASGGSFAAFAAFTLSSPAPDASPKTKAAPKPRVKKEKGRLAWSAAEKKVFKDVVESSGSTVNEENKAEFEAYVAEKSDEDFKAFAMAGHMRAWADTKKAARADDPTAKAGNGMLTPAEHLTLSMASLSVQDAKDADAEEEDEDFEEFEFEGEQFVIGTRSGDILQPTEEAGDVKVGTAGVGKFKDVKKPQ